MTDLVPELAALPIAATLDGELVAFGPDGSPDFPRLCERMLMRRPGIAMTYMIFDLLSLDGDDLRRAPYSERRAQLEALDLNGVFWQRSRASLRNNVTPRIDRGTAGGSRLRTVTTGATSWKGRAHSTSRV
jgi:ATP-dependent DNA ligase